MFGPAQAAVARGVVDSVREGVISEGDVDDLCIIVGVFIHWEAKDDQKIYDFNYALGGPIRKNRIWFFTAHRHWGFQNFKSDAFYEVNPLDYIWDYAPGRLTPSADARAFDDQELQSHNLRLTTQLNASNKISAYYDYQPRCTCHWQVSATRSGEASVIQRLPLNWQGTVTYTSTLSSKLLLSAGFGVLNTRWTQIAQTDRVPIDPATGHRPATAAAQPAI